MEISRLKRKELSNQDINIVNGKKIGIFYLFDNNILSIFRITDEVYDYIAEYTTDDELDILFKEELTFAEKRIFLLKLESCILKYNQINNGIII